MVFRFFFNFLKKHSDSFSVHLDRLNYLCRESKNDPLEQITNSRKLIVFVTTCKKYESRAKLIADTWAYKRSEVWFATDDKLSTLPNTVFTGNGNTCKPINMKNLFEHMLKHDDGFFMIIDDDSYLRVDLLNEYLQFFDPNDSFILGDFLSWGDNHRTDKFRAKTYHHWGSGGPGFVLTRKCIKEFLSVAHANSNENHDAWLHQLFLKTDRTTIKRIHCPGFHQYGHENLINSESKYISVHLNHDIDYMIKFHKKHNS